MELAARGEFGECFAFSHRDILQAVIAKHPFHRLDDVFKDKPCRRPFGWIYPHFEISLASLDQLDPPGIVVFQIEDERRQRHLAHANERGLAAFDLKTAERRPTWAGFGVEPNTVAEVISDEGLNLVGQHRQQRGCRQRAIGNGPHRFVDRFEDDPVFVDMLPPVAALERQRQALGAAIGIGNAVFQ